MILRILDDATAEFADAIAHYEDIEAGLGEKLELLEAVWSELSSETDTIDVPQWHKDILDERQRGLEQDSMKAMDWELAKEHISHRVR